MYHKVKERRKTYFVSWAIYSTFSSSCKSPMGVTQGREETLFREPFVNALIEFFYEIVLCSETAFEVMK